MTTLGWGMVAMLAALFCWFAYSGWSVDSTVPSYPSFFFIIVYVGYFVGACARLLVETFFERSRGLKWHD